MLRPFRIVFSKGVKEDLESFRAYDRRIVLKAIEMQLTHTPHIETKKCKLLRNLIPPFEAIPPIWQLRVGVFRVFYDVNEGERQVAVRAIRRKPTHLKTEEIL
jgi:mRNA-degrading endonuclease RelE of RelBE toxin-antitoxin system